MWSQSQSSWLGMEYPLLRVENEQISAQIFDMGIARGQAVQLQEPD